MGNSTKKPKAKKNITDGAGGPNLKREFNKQHNPKRTVRAKIKNDPSLSGLFGGYSDADWRRRKY
jgi:hypothetical protein